MEPLTKRELQVYEHIARNNGTFSFPDCASDEMHLAVRGLQAKGYVSVSEGSIFGSTEVTLTPMGVTVDKLTL